MKKIRKQTITNKTILFIPLLLIVLALFFSLNTVSAADNDTIYVANNGSDANDGFSWNTPKLSIQNATGTVNANGTINIANGTYKGEKNTNIIINKNMTIIGDSQTGTIIDGENKNWIFNIASGFNVLIRDLTLKGGNATLYPHSNGGAIYNIGNLTVANCTFINNTASNDGGAIYNTMNGTLTLTNCTFTGNNANWDGGGAIYNGNPHSDAGLHTATLNANGCSFLNNTGHYYGGAIMNNQYSICILNDCTFTNNVASDTGGGAIWNNYYCYCTITGSDFTNNTGNYGGAIMNYGILAISDSNFINNTANAAAGAIMHYVHTCTIENCTFTGNNARGDGGAICNWGNSSELNGPALNIINSTFIGNSASVNYGSGGAIYNRFSILSETNMGSGLVTCILTNCKFNNNTANEGGAIYNYCYVHYSGSAGSITCNMSGCTFNNNTATNSGGAIYNKYDVTGGLTPITSTMAECVFNNNSAINGGVIYNEDSNLTCTDSTFIGNNAEYGGAICSYCWSSSLTINIENCTFTGNNASVGGAIRNKCFADGSLTNLVSNSTFVGNTADWGGAIENECDPCISLNIAIENSTFISNIAILGGGAICNMNNNGASWTSNVINCTFRDNIAYWAGGAIYNANGNGIYGNLTSNVENCTFTGNIASGIYGHGGAIFNDRDSGFLTNNVMNNIFIGNNANCGGAIANEGTCAINSCTFNNNTAINSGGAIYNDGGTNEIHFNRIVGNTAANGTALNCHNGTVNAINNWWGNNDDPMIVPNLISVQSGFVDADPWIVLRINAIPYLIGIFENSAVYVTLKYNSNGDDTSSLGAVPDVGVVLSATLGTLNQYVGVISGGLDLRVLFTADNMPGFAIVNAIVDSETNETSIHIVRDDVYVATAADGGSDSNNGSSNSPFLTLNKAISELRSGGRIHIANGVYNGAGNRGLIIDKNMVIMQDNWISGTVNSVIIDAEQFERIFNINAGVNVTLQNIVLNNGKASYGGAIFNLGSLNAKNCTFTNNNATDGGLGGGAIFNGFYINLDSVSIINCNLTNCTFTNNNAGGSGGAIINTIVAYSGSVSLNCTINNCTFIENHAWGAGGAILNHCYANFGFYGSIDCKIISCFFINNSASYYRGGAIGNYIHIEGSGSLNCDIINCTLTNNTATLGGAIYNFGSGLRCFVNFNRIFGNTAGQCSAIYNEDSFLDAENNWWGTNNPNWSTLISGFAPPTNWVILSVNATPNKIYNTQNSTITADFIHVNGGGDLIGGHIPDGTINLEIPWGSFTKRGITHLFTANTFAGVMTATFYANEGAINPLYNPVRVNATSDTYTTNDTESAYIAFKTADISINKTFEDTNHNPIISANYQDTIVIYLKVTNNGPDDAEWVAINDIIPADCVPVESDDGYLEITSNNPYGGWVYYSSLQNLTIYLAEISNGASNDVWINVTNIGHNNSLITNTACLDTMETTSYDPNHDNNNSTASYTANAAAHVTVNKSVNNSTPNYNDLVTYTITAHNNGPDTATGLQITDKLPEMTFGFDPAILIFVSSNATVGTYDPATGVWNIGTLLNGTDGVLSIVCNVTGTGNYTNWANVTAQSTHDYLPWSKDNETIYVPISDLYLNIFSSDLHPSTGEIFTLTYKIGNNGPDNATNVIINIPLPAGFILNGITGDGTWIFNAANSSIIWTLANVPVGDPYLYISGKFNKPGAYVFSSSISSNTYNINTQGTSSITINAVQAVNAAGKTVGMQNTGLPINYLILAILAVYGGILVPKRK